MEAAAAAMASLAAPPCTSSSPSTLFLAPSASSRRTVPRAAVRASAAAAARPTLSAGWDLSGLSAARPAARKARLEELDTTNMLLRQRIVFLGSPVVKEKVQNRIQICNSLSVKIDMNMKGGIS
ncbi:hypothetical protein EJB05_15585, partial [Eragrostis curvula]